MENSSKSKRSRIILALDVAPRVDLLNFIKNMIFLLEAHICAIKINFHLILPLSSSEISEINKIAHSFNLQSIADIKLNDIPNTNKIAMYYLFKMGFDAIIVNPFMGKKSLRSAVAQAHRINRGIIALVYMSHPEAKESFGLTVTLGKNNNKQNNIVYKVFHDNAYRSDADGIVVGATQSDILKEISCQKRLPIYSPGFGTQGGNIKEATLMSIDYFIIGRSIINNNPLKSISKIKQIISI